SSPSVAAAHLHSIRQRRDKELAAVQKTFTELGKQVQLASYLTRNMDELQVAAAAVRVRYDTVEQALDRGEALTSDIVKTTTAALRDAERRFWTQSAELAKRLEEKVLE